MARRHRLIFWLLAFPLLLVVLIAALLSTPPATRLVVSKVLPMINRRINGTLTIAEARGSLFGRLEFRGVTLVDPSGAPLASAERVVIGYQLLDLIRGKLKIDPLILQRPSIQLVQDRPGEPYPLLRAFQNPAASPTPAPPGGRSTLTAEGIEIAEGAVVITVSTQNRAVGEETTAGSPLRTVHLNALDLKVPLLRVSSGGGGPLDAEIRIDAATGEVPNPSVSLKALRGWIRMIGDSISLDLRNAELPASKLSAEGWITLGAGERPTFDGTLRIAHLGTADLTALIPRLPPGWTVRGDLQTSGGKSGNVNVEASTIEVAGGKQAGAVRGHLSLSVTPDGHWRQRDTRVQFDDLDLGPLAKQITPPLTTPVSGRLNGTVLANGSQDSLQVSVDLALRQSISDTAATSRIKGSGEIALPLGGNGFVRDFTIDTAELDLRAVRAMSPSLPLTGRADLSGKFSGSMQDMAFNGVARYQEGSLPPSVLRASVRLTRYSPLQIEADLVLDSLRLDGFQQSFPKLARAGAVGGHLRLTGPFDTLTVAAEVGGTPGRVRLAGTVTRGTGAFSIQNGDGTADSINLAAISSRFPKSLLFARFSGSAATHDGTLERADIRLAVDSSLIGEMAVTTASVVAKTGGGLLLLDSLLVRATGLELDGGGTLGLTDHRGTVTLKARADPLEDLKPLFALVDTAGTMTPRSGTLELDATVSGSLRSYVVEFTARAEKVAIAAAALRSGALAGSWATSTREFAVRSTVDSLTARKVMAERVEAAAEGTLKSFAWRGTALFGQDRKASGSGTISGDSVNGRTFDLDSLSISRDSVTWRLDQPGRIELHNDRWSFSHTELTRVGPGDPSRIALTGTLSGHDSSGRVSAVIENFPLADIATLPTTIGGGGRKPFAGTLDARFDLTGSVSHPRGDGQLTLLDARYDTLPLPELRARAEYTGGVLDANLLVVLGTRPSSLEARVPLRGDAEDKTARLTLTLDSLSLGGLRPLLPTLQGLDGRVDGTVEMIGTFDQPQMSGQLALAGGEATVPSLGIRYHDMNGKLAFDGQRVRVDSFTVTTGSKGAGQSLVVDGNIEIEPLNNPVLDLSVTARNFAVMNDENLFQGDASGDLKLAGPLYGATATGNARVNTGTLFVQQFLQKRIIDLSDSVFAQFVDTTVLRKERLEADPISRFIDQIQIDHVDVSLGENFRMVSDDANVQLSGHLVVGKKGNAYTADGTVNTVRGTYTLRVAPGTRREFEVEEGSIRYFGTEDLNGVLDIRASHELQTSTGDRIDITVHVTGTVEEPKIDFSSDTQPPLAETELISYLIFGAPSFQAFMNDESGERRSVFEQSVASFAGVLSGRIESGLAGVLPVDYFRIQPGEVQNGLSGTELVVGKQVSLFGFSSWLKASPRICPGEDVVLSIDQIGVSVETRFSRRWGVNASIDPIRGCESNLPPSSTHYGLGFDVFWEKRGLGSQTEKKK